MDHKQAFSHQNFDALNSTDEIERKPVHISGARWSGKWSGHDYAAYAYVIGSCVIVCQLHIINLSNQAKVPLFIILVPSIHNIRKDQMY